MLVAEGDIGAKMRVTISESKRRLMEGTDEAPIQVDDDEDLRHS